MRKKGFTLIELLVVIAIIAMLLAILMPALNKVKKIAQRVVCGTNLKGLGTAQSVYANDYEDQFTKQGGTGGVKSWGRFTSNFDVAAKSWGGDLACTVGSSLYLLVREADVSPKSFVCSAGGQSPYDGKNSTGNDLVELWDFGNPNVLDAAGKPCGGGPTEHVSYGFQQPFGPFPASGSSTASFAIMADKNPWFDPKLTEAVTGGTGAATADTYSGIIQRIGPYWNPAVNVERWAIQVANAYPHSREGQNVAFGDGHSEYCKTADVGVKHDNIYTRQMIAAAGTTDEGPVRGGDCNAVKLYVAPVKGSPILVTNASKQAPVSAQDSLMVNDDDQL
jgi:prepilin-type N-terminal cleavage/methylation domain-containing protein